MTDLKTELEEPRELSSDEWRILNKMMSVDFEGKEIILEQLRFARVISYCPCGCKTIDIQIDKDVPKYQYEKRIPVELMILSKTGVPIIASIHIENGYIKELEVYRADSREINEEIILDNATIETY